VSGLPSALEIALERFRQMIFLKSYTDNESASSSLDIEIEGDAIVVIEPLSHCGERVGQRAHLQN